jgi:hypothetical protein
VEICLGKQRHQRRRAAERPRGLVPVATGFRFRCRR